ncbi:MAG: DUF6036 family nucleotidyltransferase [Cytophagaceae bacterium]
MDILDETLLSLWKAFEKFQLKYIIVGGFATNLHGFNRITADCDIFIKDTPENRLALKNSLESVESLDFSFIDTTEFAPGWSSVTLSSGLALDIMTYMAGIPAEKFDECYNVASEATIYDCTIHFLHINHLIEAKLASNRSKDKIDVEELIKIRDARNNKD